MAPHEQTEFFACLALRNAERLGPRAWQRLVGHYGSALAAVADVRGWAAHGLVPRERAESFRAGTWRENAEREWRNAQACGYGVLLHSDPGFPERLRRIPDPPLFLYVHGDVTLLANPAVAVVGSRSCTGRGREATAAIARDLARAGITVASGLAWGIDRAAHLAALEEVGSTVAVLGTGMDLIYPADNRDLWMQISRRGLIVTEFAPGRRPERFNFPQRNRIISGLSLGVLVAEAPERSGAMNTANHAVVQNREVFALQGPEDQASFSGCRRLIEEGATPVSGADDILRELAPLLRRGAFAGAETGPGLATFAPPAQTSPPSGPDPGSEPGPEPAPDGAHALDADEGAVAALFADGGSLHIDAVGEILDWDAARVSRALLALEVRGLVRRLPGMVYVG